jgi:uncharacterized protein (UPF0333 family)
MDQTFEFSKKILCLVIIIAIIVIIYYVYTKSEHLAVAYSAGASQRFKSEFSSPSQGDRTTDYNTELIALQKRGIPKK